ncbi:unnamed protein product [Caenorhabditis brenneri]
MSLSRPATFPLLKLPFLCIECVIKDWGDIFDIISFALVSQRTRRIVKILKISLNRIEIYVLEQKLIKLGSMYKIWSFKTTSLGSLYLRKDPFVLQDNAIPLYTRRTDFGFESYTDENEVTALKIAMEFLNDLFKCSVEQVDIIDSDFPESFGVKSTGNFFLHYENSQFGLAQNQKLMVLLENLEVTGTCKFWVPNPKKNFYVDPKLFKCKKLVFSFNSADWVTREILLQFEVPRLTFYDCPFSVEDIVAFVTYWFHSDNKKLEYLYISYLFSEFSLEEFRTAELNPVPFSERNRVPLTETFTGIDFSKELEIIRLDGLVATIHAKRGAFLFYIWHSK